MLVKGVLTSTSLGAGFGVLAWLASRQATEQPLEWLSGLTSIAALAASVDGYDKEDLGGNFIIDLSGCDSGVQGDRGEGIGRKRAGRGPAPPRGRSVTVASGVD
jgi:hypothetical protein